MVLIMNMNPMRKLERLVRANEEVKLVEMVTSNQQAWAFTIKKTGRNLTDVKIEDYALIIDKFNKAGFIKDIAKENDSKGVLHLHGIILLRKGFLRKSICLNGFHVKLVEIYDENGWLGYITKYDRREALA